MKNTILPLICMLICLTGTNAQAESTLSKIYKVGGRDSVQIFLSLDKIPEFSSKISKKRIDIILSDATFSSDIGIFETDNRIIKVVPSSHAGDTIVSFFFRYPPQKVALEPTSDDKLVLEILLGNQYSRSYRKLSEKLQGLSIVESKSTDFTNPKINSPYTGDWLSFFREYEADIEIDVPIEFTIPPFPIISLIPPGREENSKLLPAELYELAEQNLWDDMQSLILEQIRNTSNGYDSKLLALCLGEALLRKGDFEASYKQLYLLQEEYSDEHVGIFARYLLILLQARQGDIHLADHEYKKMKTAITANYPLAPYFLLSRIETALATDQHAKMKQLLNLDSIPLPDNAYALKELRYGDYYTATGQPVKTFVSYQLLKDSHILNVHPFSHTGYCQTLYGQKKYVVAADCFENLGLHVTDNDALGLISFRKSMAENHFKESNQLIENFVRIEDAFPGTEAAFRSAVKRTDLKYLADRDWAKEAVKHYRALSQTAVNRPVAAEAAFKEALVYSLNGDNETSVELLQQFLRDFRMGEVRHAALALLIDILPKEIERHISEGDYIKALVLAKQNRNLFENNWLDIGLLADIASAYQKVGIFSEARRVYLYLIEVADIDKKEEFFLPLIESTFDQGEYSLVEDFASQYSYNYPEGFDTEKILIFRLKALLASDQFDKAQRFLPEPLPKTSEIRLLAASLFFRNSAYQKARETIESLEIPVDDLPQEARFIIAESCFQLLDASGASELFPKLVESEQFGDQALFRMAELESDSGNNENALKLYKKIVDKGNDTLWRKYAERELEYSRLTLKIDQLMDG